MKYKILLLTALITILLATAAHATVVAPYDVRLGIFEEDGSYTTTTNTVSGVNAQAHRCLVAGCSQVNQNPFQVTYSQTNSVTLNYPTTLQQHGYAAYFYKDGYIGWEQRNIDWAGTGTAPTETIYLSRVRRGYAPIINYTVYNDFDEVSKNKPITFGVNVGIDAVTKSFLVNTQETNIPLSEALTIRARVEIRDSQNNIISSPDMFQDIVIEYDQLSSEYAPIEFTYPGFDTAGNYTITLFTAINDAKVMQTPASSASFQITVIDPDATDYSYSRIDDLTCPDANLVGNTATVSFTHYSYNVAADGTETGLGTNIHWSLEKDGIIISQDLFAQLPGVTHTTLPVSIPQSGNYRILIEASPLDPQGDIVLPYTAACTFSLGDTSPVFTTSPSHDEVDYLEPWNGALFEAEDETGTVTFSVNDSRFTITDGLLEWNNPLSVGVYPVQVTAGNAHGNTSTTFTLTVNKIHPQLAIQGTTQAAYSSTTSVEGLGCPSELTCTLKRNGTAVANPDIQTNLLPGAYTYTYSTAGNENYFPQSVQHTLTITSTPLVLNITSPLEGQVFNQSTVPVTYSISGGVLNYSCQHVLLGPNNIYQTYNECDNFNWLHLTNGNYSMITTVTDAINNSVSKTTDFIVHLAEDPTEPFEVNISRAIDGNNVTFTVTSTQPMIECSFSHHNNQTKIFSVNTNPTTFLVVTEPFSPGSYNIRATCTSEDNESAFDNTTFTIAVQPTPGDDIIPVTIQSPSGNYMNITEVDLNYTVSNHTGAIDCTYTINGASNPAPNCHNTTIPVIDGQNIVTVFAIDSLGNSGNATSIFFVNNTIPPIPPKTNFTINVSASPVDNNVTFFVEGNQEITFCTFYNGITFTVQPNAQSFSVSNIYPFGNHLVFVDCTSDQNQTATDNVSFDILTTPETPTVTVSSTPDRNTGNVTFHITASHPMTGCSFTNGENFFVGIANSMTATHVQNLPPGFYNFNVVCDTTVGPASTTTSFTLLAPATPTQEPIEAPKHGIQIVNFDIHDNDHLRVGEQDLNLRFRNSGGATLQNVIVQASIPELGVWTRAGPITLRPGQEVTRIMLLDIYDATPGFYYLRLTFTTNSYSRAVWYEVYIE